MNWLLPFLAAGLMASCHPAHAVAVVAAHPVAVAHPAAARAAPARAATPSSRPAPVIVPVVAPERRSSPCDAQPQHATCKR